MRMGLASWCCWEDELCKNCPPAKEVSGTWGCADGVGAGQSTPPARGPVCPVSLSRILTFS